MGQVVSLSGGKDSTAMLLMMLERGERVDEAVIFDTGWEYPEMHEHLLRLEAYTSERYGFDAYTVLVTGRSFDFFMFDHVRTRGEHKGEKGYGWARPNARWCTKLKTSAIDRHLSGRGAVQCIGIAADEAHRAKDKRYPLIEWGVTEAEALAYCRARGFDWGGLYDCHRRLSCWCCPLQGLSDLRALRRTHPELWSRLRDMDGKTWNSFRCDYTIEQLEERFAHEDLQMSLEDL